jgi:hypothetical protein
MDEGIKVQSSQQTMLPKQTARKRNRSEKTTGRVAGTIHQPVITTLVFRLERTHTMNSAKISTIVLAVTSLAWGSAFAADSGLTRDQVKAELAAAQRTGNVIVNSESGALAKDVFPSLYPVAYATEGLSRDQVKAELAAAQQAGNVIVNGETGQTVAELLPARFPATLTTKTRAEVKAELAEAQRTGNIVINGETGQTLAQAYPARYTSGNAVAQNPANAQISAR